MTVISRTCQEEAGVLTPLTPTPLNTPTRPHPLSFPVIEINEDGVIDQEMDDRLDMLIMENELSDAHIEEMAIKITEQQQTVTEPSESHPSLLEDDGEGILTANECQELLLQCHELLSVVCDVLHSRCTKILNIRAKVCCYLLLLFIVVVCLLLLFVYCCCCY